MIIYLKYYLHCKMLNKSSVTLKPHYIIRVLKYDSCFEQSGFLTDYHKLFLLNISDTGMSRSPRAKGKYTLITSAEWTAGGIWLLNSAVVLLISTLNKV